MEDLSKNTIDPKTKKVMIVDDDESLLELLGVVIQREGFQIVTVANGDEALRKAPQSMPDLILLDMMLPQRGGFEVLRQLQTGEAGRIPVVVMTGRYTEATTGDMIRQEPNVVDFLTKPIKPPLLTNLIHKLLKTRPPEISGRPTA